MYSLRNIILSLTYQDRINGPIEIRIANPGGKLMDTHQLCTGCGQDQFPHLVHLSRRYSYSSYNQECWGDLRLVQCTLAYISDLDLWIIQERGKVGILTCFVQFE